MQQGVPEQRGDSVDLEMQYMRRLEKIIEKQVQKGGYTDESINHACLCSHPHSSIITHGMFKSLLSWLRNASTTALLATDHIVLDC